VARAERVAMSMNLSAATIVNEEERGRSFSWRVVGNEDRSRWMIALFRILSTNSTEMRPVSFWLYTIPYREVWMIRHVKGIRPSRANASKRALELERPTGSNLLHSVRWQGIRYKPSVAPLGRSLCGGL
jgi:hypothetical protein